MLYATISYFYKKNFADFSMGKFHTHSKNNVEIMYVCSGKCRIITPEQTLTINSGNYIILANECPHSLKAENASIMNIEFYLKRQGDISLDDILNEFPELSNIFSKKISIFNDNGQICDTLRNLINELGERGKTLYSTLLFKSLIIELCRNRTSATLGGVVYISKAKEYINAHLCEKITIDDISEYVNLSSAYLQTLFKAHTDKTLTQYINGLRIEKACFILKNHNLPIIDIAIDCGFASRQHFMRTFKMHTGLSVGQYRKNNLL